MTCTTVEHFSTDFKETAESTTVHIKDHAIRRAPFGKYKISVDIATVNSVISVAARVVPFGRVEGWSLAAGTCEYDQSQARMSRSRSCVSS